MTLVVRTGGDPTSLFGEVRSTAREVDPAVALTPRTMDSLVQDALAVDRFLTFLLGLFAGVALVLAAVGLFGVVSYGVRQRIREIGVRIALGAGGRDIRRLVVVGTLALTGLGTTIGLAGAFGLTRFLEGLLFGISPTDPVTFVLTVAVLGIVAIAASALPAQRAVRVDPVTVLKAE